MDIWTPRSTHLYHPAEESLGTVRGCEDEQAKEATQERRSHGEGDSLQHLDWSLRGEAGVGERWRSGTDRGCPPESDPQGTGCIRIRPPPPHRERPQGGKERARLKRRGRAAGVSYQRPLPQAALGAAPPPPNSAPSKRLRPPDKMSRSAPRLRTEDTVGHVRAQPRPSPPSLRVLALWRAHLAPRRFLRQALGPARRKSFWGEAWRPGPGGTPLQPPEASTKPASPHTALRPWPFSTRQPASGLLSLAGPAPASSHTPAPPPGRLSHAGPAPGVLSRAVPPPGVLSLMGPPRHPLTHKPRPHKSLPNLPCSSLGRWWCAWQTLVPWSFFSFPQFLSFPSRPPSREEPPRAPQTPWGFLLTSLPRRLAEGASPTPASPPPPGLAGPGPRTGRPRSQDRPAPVPGQAGPGPRTGRPRSQDWPAPVPGQAGPGPWERGNAALSVLAAKPAGLPLPRGFLPFLAGHGRCSLPPFLASLKHRAGIALTLKRPSLFQNRSQSSNIQEPESVLPGTSSQSRRIPCWSSKPSPSQPADPHLPVAYPFLSHIPSLSGPPVLSSLTSAPLHWLPLCQPSPGGAGVASGRCARCHRRRDPEKLCCRTTGQQLPA
ncbi:uncharacterized protein ACOB8E_000968 [Sarcophilus harrisii]